MGQSTDPARFDEAFGVVVYTQFMTHEMLMTGDWAKGPAGTNECPWTNLLEPPPSLLRGQVAESWEIDGQTIVWHIRKGIHWQVYPESEAFRLANGRELTADDVIFSKNYLWSSPSSHMNLNVNKATHVEQWYAPDKWTVVCKTKPGKTGYTWRIVGMYSRIYPREVIEKYGSQRDWKNAVGSGPWILTDYVSGSSLTYKRNPNYWMDDPVNPGYKLPYFDGVKMLIIPDVSTRLAALRTGKIDVLFGLTWDDARSLMQTNPELKHNEYVSSSPQQMHFRVDRPELPIYDVNVRKALCMAVDRQAIANDYYSGHANLLAWPVAPFPEFIKAGTYRPLETLPESTREQFEYNPEKAKKLLDAAGYPNGFKLETICYSAEQSDLASIVAGYWAKIGVKLDIQVKEYTVWSSIGTRRTALQTFIGSISSGWPFQFMGMRPNDSWNYSHVNDPRIDEQWVIQDQFYFDFPKKSKMYYDFLPYVYDKVLNLQFPAPSRFNFWQPWLMNFHGESQVGNAESTYERYIWMDQDMKKAMTGGR